MRHLVSLYIILGATLAATLPVPLAETSTTKAAAKNVSETGQRTEEESLHSNLTENADIEDSLIAPRSSNVSLTDDSLARAGTESPAIVTTKRNRRKKKKKKKKKNSMGTVGLIVVLVVLCCLIILCVPLICLCLGCCGLALSPCLGCLACSPCCGGGDGCCGSSDDDD